MDLEKLKELNKQGFVSDAQLTRAKILIRHKELCKKYEVKGDVYFLLSEEFCLSEGRIKNIISGS